MSAPNPQPVANKSGGYQQENTIQTSVADLYQFFQPKTLKVSKVSPPGTNDVKELELVIDKTTSKLWTKINGSLLSMQFS